MTLFEYIKSHNTVLKQVLFTKILLNNMFYKLYEISGYDF